MFHAITFFKHPKLLCCEYHFSPIVFEFSSWRHITKLGKQGVPSVKLGTGLLVTCYYRDKNVPAIVDLIMTRPSIGGVF